MLLHCRNADTHVCKWVRYITFYSYAFLLYTQTAIICVCVCVCFLSPTQQHLEAAEVATVCGCKATKHSKHNLYMDFKNRNVTFTVLPLAPLPCRMHGSIVATAPCLFIPDAAAAILGRQRREQAGVRGWTPDNFRFRLFSEQLSGVA